MGLRASDEPWAYEPVMSGGTTHADGLLLEVVQCRLVCNGFAVHLLLDYPDQISNHAHNSKQWGVG